MDRDSKTSLPRPRQNRLTVQENSVREQLHSSTKFHSTTFFWRSCEPWAPAQDRNMFASSCAWKRSISSPHARPARMLAIANFSLAPRNVKSVVQGKPVSARRETNTRGGACSQMCAFAQITVRILRRPRVRRADGQELRRRNGVSR